MESYRPTRVVFYLFFICFVCFFYFVYLGFCFVLFLMMDSQGSVLSHKSSSKAGNIPIDEETMHRQEYGIQGSQL